MTSRSTAGRSNGTDGLWTFIFIDMCVFALFFLVFAAERQRLPGLYAASQGMLDEKLAFANTIVLLTSSWAMAEAVQAARAGVLRRSRRCLLAVLGCGLVFCGLKVSEYAAKYQAGIGVTENSFFSLYYFITALHLLHLVGGMLFIRALFGRMGRPGEGPVDIRFVENVGLFWHFVDLLWLFIFPLLYLIGRP
jgi:nitric oxide reductase NorE protein